MNNELIVTASTGLKLSFRKSGRKVLAPRDLCRDRGLCLEQLSNGAIFFDRLLGYAILREEDANILRHRGRTFDKTISSRNIVLELKDRKVNDNPSLDNWHLTDLGGWPAELTGREQRIAVLDYGIEYGLEALPRRHDHQDFCSCNKVADFTNDITGHGTECAGVIAARVSAGEARRSILPDCAIVAAQIAKRCYSKLTTLADLLLMLSWVIHRWDVRVVSMSFCASVRDEGHGGDDVLGLVAWRLRRLDRALIFCAAEEADGKICYPASAAAVIPVGPYYVDSRNVNGSQIGLLIGEEVSSVSAWTMNPELLLGPGSSLKTVNQYGQRDDDFGAVSGACAFAAGVAGLYMEAYPGFSVERILRKMHAETRGFTSKRSGSHTWNAVRFPRRKRPPRIQCLLGKLQRTICRMFYLLKFRLFFGWRG